MSIDHTDHESALGPQTTLSNTLLEDRLLDCVVLSEASKWAFFSCKLASQSHP